ncbi:hypothetical protein TRICI_003328 [Trichomonascus ciferrii]|uniref:DNA mismatch repair proteins mutS family domain-containing protein n=1 Tax=Trichomonascus ciferrii TaxID=44093 RepID=A0A642V4A3_9ASCO|nr:hypothetical protein TRICI_003328 [Trichomonascus ciferrii]
MYAFKTAVAGLFERRIFSSGLSHVGCFRGNSTLTKISYNELGAKYFDSGKLPLEPVSGSKAATKKMSMYQGIRKTMVEHPSSIVLTQVGSFYELYFEQAAEFGPKLNLKVAKKQSQEVPNGFVFMAGFPCYQLDRYLKMLVNDLAKNVTLVEQFELPGAGSTKNIERRVTRTITPGTLISESFIDAHRANYLLSIVFTNAHLEKVPTEDSPVGLSWIDLSVGSFYYQSTTVKDLASDIARLQPKEILLDSDIRRYGVECGKWYADLSDLSRYFISYQRFPNRDDFGQYSSTFADVSVSTAEYRADNTGYREVTAMMAILSYLKENLPESQLSVRFPQKVVSTEVMKMDNRSMEALEIFQSTGNVTRGSLFNTIKRTVSPSGTRLLNRWLSEPLVDIGDIERRHDLVEFFLHHRNLSRQVYSELSSINDCMRLLQKINLRKVDPTDLVALVTSVFSMEKILRLFKDHNENAVVGELIERLQANIKDPIKLAKRAYKWLDTESIMVQESSESEETPEEPTKKPKRISTNGMVDKPIMKETASVELSRLYEDYRSFDELKMELQKRLTDDQNPGVQVSLKWSPQYLYYAHVTLSGLKKGVTFDDVRVPGTILNQTKNRQCIQNSEWAVLGTNRERILEKKKVIEERLLEKLRREALQNRVSLRECCDVIDELDVLISFATLTREYGLIRPQMALDSETNIISGRHLTVETGLINRGVNFVPNDCHLDNDKIWVITGPNMGGKSTFIRQIAVTTVLAQIGCYVPAQSATIGVVDQIFCRVGAADDLYRDRSTFMVEMLETSSILRNATPRSLAILDEVGRGTSGRDGLAIAYATIMHLSQENNCRALFATHFGQELHQLLQRNNLHEAVDYYHTDILETPQVEGISSFSFDYKLKKGVCVESQGIKVAALAGFPNRALEIAKEAMSTLDTD